jgi:hypothetical protein
MTQRGMQMTFLSTSLAVMLAISTGGMAMGLPDGPVRMSNIPTPKVAGYPVFDSHGEKVGELVRIASDDQGRARWIDVALAEGGQARVASFRAFIDLKRKEVDVVLPRDLLYARTGVEPAGLPGEPVVLPEMSS